MARKTMTFDDLKAGNTPDAALAAYRAGCNQGRERLFITDSWFGPREARLRASLPDPLTEHVAEALRGVVLRTHHIDTVIDWLEHGAKPWHEYEAWRNEENRRLALERMREGYFPWEDVALKRAVFAALMSGVAFYLISDIWIHEAAHPSLLVHFAAWTFAFAPGFFALFWRAPDQPA